MASFFLHMNLLGDCEKTKKKKSWILFEKVKVNNVSPNLWFTYCVFFLAKGNRLFKKSCYEKGNSFDWKF